MKHELQVFPQFYVRLADGSKTFDVQENSPGFQPGDVVVYLEFNPGPVNPTSNAPKGLTDSPHWNSRSAMFRS
jgi:hypothetical protein